MDQCAQEEKAERSGWQPGLRYPDQKIYPSAADILELHDLIQLHLPDLYNKVRGGKFGHLTGVTTYKGKRRAHLHFTGAESKYGVPAGFTYPILGGFRALLAEKGGRYVWGKNLDPVALLKNGLGETLADTIGILPWTRAIHPRPASRLSFGRRVTRRFASLI
jgi:hypothetical protein